MMVTCKRAELADAVGGIARVVPPRNPSEALRCVHLVAEHGVLRLAATDAEIGLRLVLDSVVVDQDGEALIPADRLAEIVRSCDGESIQLRTDGHKLDVKTDTGHFVVIGMEPTMATPVATAPEAGDVTLSVSVDAATLRRLVTRTAFAAATETSRYAINGVLMECTDGRLRMVATDGHRLAVANGRAASAEGSGTAIIPTKALGVLVRLLDMPEEMVEIRVSRTQAFFRVGTGTNPAELATRLVEGAFPPFEDVIPKEQDKRATAAVDVFTRALQQASLYTNKDSKGVRMNFDDGSLTLTSRVPEEGEAEIKLPLDYEGDPIQIGFNAGYLGEALKVLDEPTLTIELKAENKPGVLRTGNDFLYVIMPLHLH
ncbi:MAG: DNA polymerase III subunit beta [Planctomycetota bacterium]|jgi:DNA polymerase-3 subunit beta